MSLRTGVGQERVPISCEIRGQFVPQGGRHREDDSMKIMGPWAVSGKTVTRGEIDWLLAQESHDARPDKDPAFGRVLRGPRVDRISYGLHCQNACLCMTAVKLSASCICRSESYLCRCKYLAKDIAEKCLNADANMVVTYSSSCE